MLEFLKVLGLFSITALAEILGCYLPWLVLGRGAMGVISPVDS
mgnify:CR=1 FL=1